MATELNINVICEGVETKEQVEMLKGFGCHAVQGYYYGKPMPVDEFIEKYCVIKK
jgi:EAL domain-containing protein (putative c-di-GMP-specific phosphodiesterase class I)